MTRPHLTRHDTAHTPLAVVLMLHGGKPNSEQPVDGRNASWQRMAAMQRALASPLSDVGVSTWLLRYRQRGWNGGGSPTADARRGLDEVRRDHGSVPVVLLGHSMGGRVAVHVADDQAVAGVVALAPWWEPSDPVTTLRGRSLLAAHGRRDRITSFRRTAEYLGRARSSGVEARLLDMGRRGHYMLAGARAWNRAALEGVEASLKDQIRAQ